MVVNRLSAPLSEVTQGEWIPTSTDDVFHRIFALESTLSLEDFEVGGIDAWPFLRSQLAERLFREVEGRDPSLQDSWRRLRAKVCDLLAINAIDAIRLFATVFRRRIPVSGSAHLLVLTENTSKRLRRNGAWYDVYIDPLLDRLGEPEQQICILETSQRMTFARPAYRRTTSIAGDMVRLYLKSWLRLAHFEVGDQFRVAFQRYRDAMVAMGLGRHVLSERDIRFNMAIIAELAAAFLECLQRVRPRAVVLVQYSGYAGSGMCNAARSLGIPVIDVQHGVQGAYHPAYALSHVPSRGFNVLPTRFLVWSRHEKSVLDGWIPKESGMTAVICGNLIMEDFQRGTEMVRGYDRIVTGVYQSHLHKKLVLITLAWGQYLPDALFDVMSLLGEEAFFLVRIHPSTVRRERVVVESRLEAFGPSRVEFRLASTLPLHSLLRHVHAHVTGTSSVVLEALEFGVPSVITDERGRGYYQYLIDRGDAVFHADPVEVVGWIRELPVERYVDRQLSVAHEGRVSVAPSAGARDWIFGSPAPPFGGPALA